MFYKVHKSEINETPFNTMESHQFTSSPKRISFRGAGKPFIYRGMRCLKWFAKAGYVKHDFRNWAKLVDFGNENGQMFYTCSDGV